MNGFSPPLAAHALLRRWCPPDRWIEVEGDFSEVWAASLRDRGARGARLRYWREVIGFGWWRAIERFRGRSAPSGGWAGRPGPGQHPGAEWLRDVRYGLRGFRRAPGFTAVAVAILAIGIGANATMFTLVERVMLADPPLVQRPHELVRLNRVIDETRTTGSMGFPDYEYYRDANEVFAGVAAFSNRPVAVSLGFEGQSGQADAWTVTANYFEVLGIVPLHGRLLRAADDDPASPAAVAVLTEGFWRRQFGADTSVVGGTVRVNGHAFTVVGILPGGFRGLSPVVRPPDVYVPLRMRAVLMPETAWQLERINGQLSYWLRAVARLGPGVDLATARANIEVLNARWGDEFATWIAATEPDPLRLTLSPRASLDPNDARQLDALLQLLTTVVAVVLVIASSNIAILLLARASGRRREIGMRAALGASRGRIVRQLLTESLLLATAGGAVGYALAFRSAALAARYLPFGFTVNLTPDAGVLAFTLGISVAAAVVFGTAPALQLSRTDTLSLLRDTGGGRRRALLRDALVTAQIALSIVLVAGAALFMRSLLTARGLDLGYDTAGKLYLSVQLSNHGYDEQRGRTFYQQALEDVQGLPGVAGVTTSSWRPLQGMAFGRLWRPDEEHLDAGFNRVGPNYFTEFGIPMVAGRDFAASDDQSAPPVIVVNRTLAEEQWPGESAIGKTLMYENRVVYTIVGVVENATYYALDERRFPQAYFPHLQYYAHAITLMVRTTSDPATLVAPVQARLAGIDPAVAVFDVATLDDLVSEEFATYRATATLVTAFGVIALILAAAGLYGVQSYFVNRRTRDIGVRIALGAGRGQVWGGIVRRSLVLSLAGTAVGLASALAAGRAVQSMLFGVQAWDPVALTLAPVLLGTVMVVATSIPARRAARIDPVHALRDE